MCPGFGSDPADIDDVRKTAIINSELKCRSIDIAALQETRLEGNGKVVEKDYTFFWQGKPAEEPRQHGVGFAVRNSLLPMIEPPSDGTERILSMGLNTSSGKVNLMSIYAPTLTSTQDIKDKFYSELDEALKKIPTSEELFLLGDFNARVGAEWDSWPEVLGHFGIGKVNDNGQRLLELCSYRKLCVTNTFFGGATPHHRVSWRHPRSKHWHQLDLVITRRSSLLNVRNTRTYHSAVCDTDHSLVCSTVKLTPKRIYRSKTKLQPKINTSKTKDLVCCQKFQTKLCEALGEVSSLPSKEEKWQKIKDTTYHCAMSCLGKKEKKNEDWFDHNSSELEPIIAEKKAALRAYKDLPSNRNLEKLRLARNRAKCAARRCANMYWQDLSKKVQNCSETGNIQGMYQGIKQAFGPTVNRTAPLKSKAGEVIKDKSKQMERWEEHYEELYSTVTAVSEEALDSIPNLPVLTKLDDQPSIEELSEAIDALAPGKAPGKDGLPAEIFQCGKPALIEPLHHLLCQCWEEGVVQDMKDSKIITLYKNKGERTDCNNYRGISLLSIAGKAFAKVALKRLQILGERVYPESQCGFRPERSTVDMIFSLRQLQEKCQEQGKPLYVAFIDLTKAFDLVSRDGLFRILDKVGCPPKLKNFIESFHTGMMGTVQFNGSLSEPFPIKSGVKQGCVLAPTLFGIFFSLVLSFAFRSSDDGIYIHTRSDGKLFNLQRLRAKTKVRKALIRELLFADDAALVAHSEAGLQRLINLIAHACNEFRLQISLKKTEVMCQDVSCTASINIADYTLNVVSEFTYLGATVTDKLSLNSELNKRIGKASAGMSKLSKKVWENKNLSTHTKMSVYQACVLSVLLYGSETWSLYSIQEEKLNVFHLRCLRRILAISWKDHVPNCTVLKTANIPSMFALLSQRRMRWLGHVRRMSDGRIPKDILYGELAEGKRPCGRPKLRFRDVCKRDLRSLGIKEDSWEETASDRSAWKNSVKAGIESAEAKRVVKWEEKRERKKNLSSVTNSDVDGGTSSCSLFTCSLCGRICRSRIGLFSHSRSCSRNRT